MDENRHKVLWADDEIDMLRSHYLYLNERGYEVTPVSNGEDAIALMKQEDFDIVLLDEMMPGLDGLATLEQVKMQKVMFGVLECMFQVFHSTSQLMVTSLSL